MTKYDTVVLGQVVRPEGVISEGAVAIKNGRIVAIGTGREAFDADEVIDCGSSFVLPGGIDAHVHSLGEETEGYANSTMAAAAGGITTIVDHPLDLGGAPIGAQGLLAKKKRAEKEAYIDFGLLAGVTPALIEKIEDCARVEVAGYKMLMHDTAPETMPMLNDGELLEAFTRISKIGLFAGVHSENEGIVKYRIEQLRKAGKTHAKAHSQSRPEVSETEAVARACELARAANCRLHIFHVSVPRSFDIIDQARREFPGITAETAPHYLVLNEDELDRRGAYAKINPPLRSEECRLGLWERIRRGSVTFIASDHAPHGHAGKASPDIFENQSGGPGVETMMNVVFNEGVARGRISIEHFSMLMATNPAKVMGLYPKKGIIAPGSDADLTIIDPCAKWTIHGEDLHYPARWTPYEGLSVTGRVTMTMVRGKTVYRDGEILGTPGYGRFVPSARKEALKQ